MDLQTVRIAFVFGCDRPFALVRGTEDLPEWNIDDPKGLRPDRRGTFEKAVRPNAKLIVLAPVGISIFAPHQIRQFEGDFGLDLLHGVETSSSNAPQSICEYIVLPLTGKSAFRMAPE